MDLSESSLSSPTGRGSFPGNSMLCVADVAELDSTSTSIAGGVGAERVWVRGAYGFCGDGVTAGSGLDLEPSSSLSMSGRVSSSPSLTTNSADLIFWGFFLGLDLAGAFFFFAGGLGFAWAGAAAFEAAVFSFSGAGRAAFDTAVFRVDLRGGGPPESSVGIVVGDLVDRQQRTQLM